MNNNSNEEEKPVEEMKPYQIRFNDTEVAKIRDITKVEAVAPAVRSIVLKKIEETEQMKEQK